MDVQFVDRVLNCSDCQSQFIFTAGEQLFFHDKQFKNDPKRCKPCKSRRSGLAAAANGTGPQAAGLARTETRTSCSQCGVETTVPFKPTQGRPVLCRQCFQLKGRALPQAGVPPQGDAPLMTQSEAISALTDASVNNMGVTLSPDAAVLAITSMNFAQPGSNVATAADLVTMTGVLEAEHEHAVISAQMLADVLSGHTEAAEA